MNSQILYNKSKMSLTKQKLAKTLTDNKSYSNIQSFLQAVKNNKLELVEVFNIVISDCLQSKKVSLFSKLLCLRFFKDIFIQGNMDFVDALNRDIIQNICNAAAYNADFKEKQGGKVGRGDKYFIQTEGRSKSSKDVIKFGNSYVALATEIVQNLAKWYPQQPDGEISVYKDAYDQISDLGIRFPSKNIYFLPQEEQEFYENYKVWKQKYKKEQNKQVQPQEPKQVVCKQKKIEQKTVKQQQSSAQKINLAQQNVQNIQKQKKVQQNKLQSQPPQQNTEACFILDQKTVNNNIPQPKNQQKAKAQQSIDSKPSVDYQLLKSQISILKQQNIRMKQIVSEKQKQNQQLTNNFKNQLNSKNKQIQKLQKQLIQFKQKSLKRQKQLQQINKNNQLNLKVSEGNNKQSIQLLNQLNKQKQQNTKLIKNNKQNVQKIKIMENLVDKINQKQKQWKQEIENSQQQKKQMKQKLQKIAQEKQKLQIKLDQMLIKCKNQQQQLLTKQQQKQNNINLSKQQKIAHQNKQTLLNSSIPEQSFLPRQTASSGWNNQPKRNSYSQLMGLKPPTQQYSFKENRHPSNPQLRSRYSNHKTEKSKQNILKRQSSQNSYARLFNTTNMSNTNVNLFKTTTNSLHQGIQRQRLCQTYNNGFAPPAMSTMNQQFIKVSKGHNRMKSHSIFPYLEQYFDQVNQFYHQDFKKYCLMSYDTKRQVVFYKDQILQMQLVKNQSNKFRVVIINKSVDEVLIKLCSETKNVRIIQQMPLQIPKFSSKQFNLSIESTNLNLRYPIFQMGIHASKYNRISKLLIPVTLFSFISLSQSDEYLRQWQNSYLKQNLKNFRSQEFTLNENILSLQKILPYLKFYANRNQSFETEAIVSHKNIPNLQMKLTLLQKGSLCQIQTQFDDCNEINAAFAKVLIQTLNFLLI